MSQNGVMMATKPRTVIPDEIKAAALADLVFMSSGAVAAKYGLKASTIRQWNHRDEHPLAIPDVTHVTLKKQRVVALMLEYLEANLNAQIAQAYVAADPTYINRQPASELAILHGVLSDKSFRLVEALQSDGHADTEDRPG